MWLKGREHRKQRVFREFKEEMTKDNKGHQKTLEWQMFPQWFPRWKNGGETNRGEEYVLTPFGPEPMTTEKMPQPSLDEIWEKKLKRKTYEYEYNR